MCRAICDIFQSMSVKLRIIYIVFAVMCLAVSCSTPEKHQKKGDMFFAHGEYFDAAAEYKTAYSTTPRSDKEARGMRAFLMGECYRRINSTSKAEGAYRNAVRYNYVDTTTYFWLAEMQRMQGNYKAAQKNYELYLNLQPNDLRTRNGIESCFLAPEMKEKGEHGGIYKGCINWSLALEKLGRKPAYVYYFTRALLGDDAGAFHSSELWYMFGTLGRSWRPKTEGDYALSKEMMDDWTNFMKTGNPNAEGKVDWKPCTKDDPYVQVLDVRK